MATGDLEGNLERLRVQLRMIGYPHPLDVNGLKEGNPAAILPLLHFALLGYSRHVARYLADNGYPLFAKSDLRFMESTLKYLRAEHAYRCPLTVAQILSRGFAERKFLFVYDVIQVCKKKHSELVKQARQAQQARKTAKRTTTLSEIVKNIDAANVDSLHLDEALTMALEKVTQGQECCTGRFESKNLKVSGANSGGASFQANEKECGNNGMDKELSGGDADYDVDPSLSHCYEKLRAQIVEVAERMEKLILTLKGDVQRITSDMQVKLTSLEKRAQHLEQTIPLKQLMGRTVPITDVNLLRSYEGSVPFKILDESALSQTLMDINTTHHMTIGDATIHNMEISQNQSTSFVRGLLDQQEQMSTKELIASVKARCNKTKELLMGKGWGGLS